MSHCSQTFSETFMEKTTFEEFKGTCKEFEIFSNDMIMK